MFITYSLYKHKREVYTFIHKKLVILALFYFRDITKVTALLSDAIDSGKGDVAEALRPLYLDYLEKPGVGS